MAFSIKTNIAVMTERFVLNFLQIQNIQKLVFLILAGSTAAKFRSSVEPLGAVSIFRGCRD
jgi:hypothetical protein